MSWVASKLNNTLGIETDIKLFKLDNKKWNSISIEFERNGIMCNIDGAYGDDREFTGSEYSALMNTISLFVSHKHVKTFELIGPPFIDDLVQEVKKWTSS